MKKLLLAVAVFAAGYFGLEQTGRLPSSGETVGAGARSDQVIADAFDDHASNLQIEGEGIVAKTLPDDQNGSRHQRFILRLNSGLTVLVAHNIDLAPRVSSIRAGDLIEFNGEYEWNTNGGVIHWTHRDPAGRHPDGWLKHRGRLYQ